MLLVIDCGNTNTVFAVYEDGIEKPMSHWRISTNAERTADEYAICLTQLMTLNKINIYDIKNVIIATVVPATSFNLKKLCHKHFDISPMFIGESSTKLNLEVRINQPAEVGADRLVNAISAHKLYVGPLIIVDFGTATTFDVIDADGGYAGGIICPGINLSLEALYMAAAQLPRVTISPPEGNSKDNNSIRVIGNSTTTAMQSGIFWGYLAMIEGLVSRIRAEYKHPMKVIGTGGLAELFAGWSSAIEIVNSELTLDGLRMIYNYNRAIMEPE
ncbi:type III pantothenate kinase [Candidatus Endolissoclinum faulkneri L2]|uniref:Type III pantothenate kinase n=1 Tax=Candidatus Endolissoclinum faulkneri L2 TaxID=1193729 RepID=K7YGS6_9PROT|nr:type III pantothenate kinase [Candidatus Endolissoclinum faulkneri]AFX98780.1 type III pantothenate kinase [Candidatus Endolissoclinum faulkneri L2]